MIIYKKGLKNSRFLVLNIQFGVQNNRSKDFFEILFSLKGSFWGQKESFKTILGPMLGFFYCYYSQLPWPDPKCTIYEDKKPKQLELFPDFFDFRGPKPELRQFENLDSITEYVAKKIAEIVNAEECPFSEIAIIYCKKSIDDKDIHLLPKMFKSALNSKGILCNWASENYHSKRSYDITTNSVTISTIHSTKGFDYACVFLVDLDLLEENGWSKEQIKNMTYVAITRARYQLFIPYIHDNALIRRLINIL